ncbi:Hypothetical predicted protein [Scomber scombrus]|uniref:Uncharacterized protein n=1 Tax=Scomber scombrus TaxID=13677 RepID=A0AAV1NWC1_SCOSC
MCWGQSRVALPGPDVSRCGLHCHAMQPRLSLDPDVAVYPVWTAVSVDIFSKENTRKLKDRDLAVLQQEKGTQVLRSQEQGTK